MTTAEPIRDFYTDARAREVIARIEIEPKLYGRARNFHQYGYVVLKAGDIVCRAHDHMPERLYRQHSVSCWRPVLKKGLRPRGPWHVGCLEGYSGMAFYLPDGSNKYMRSLAKAHEPSSNQIDQESKNAN